MALSRPGFRTGTVIRLMTRGYHLVRWDGNVLETLHHDELERSYSRPRKGW